MTRRKSPVCLPPLTRPCLILKLCCKKTEDMRMSLNCRKTSITCIQQRMQVALRELMRA